MDSAKNDIIKLFRENVQGKKFEKNLYHKKHDGAEGHWLEEQMGIKANGNNAPDILGFEMKKDTKSKTTFGDWSPNISLWKPKDHLYGGNLVLDRDKEFLTIFGKPNPKKKGRFSWSGAPAPKINKFNKFGQKLTVDKDHNILAIYCFEADQRSNKNTIVPQKLQRNDLILVKWSSEVLQKKVEDKFGDKGWFKCIKDNNGIYHSIGFGKSFSYTSWIQLVQQGIVYFDSGMYQGNSRQYAQWRANNSYWASQIVEKHH